MEDVFFEVIQLQEEVLKRETSKSANGVGTGNINRYVDWKLALLLFVHDPFPSALRTFESRSLTLLTFYTAKLLA